MIKKTISLMLIIFIFTLNFSINTLSINTIEVASQYDWYVDDDGTADYTKIQDAIDNASDGDSVFVYNGTYYEHVTIHLANISLIGENKHTTIIDGGGSKYILKLAANNIENIVITGFTVQNSGKCAGYPQYDAGVYVYYSGDNITIFDNIITNNEYGIYLHKSNNANITNNTIKSNRRYSIFLDRGNKNKIINNYIYNTTDIAIGFRGSKNNIIDKNQIIKNKFAAHLSDGSNNNIFSNNTIVDSTDEAISISSSGWGYNQNSKLLGTMTPPPRSNDNNKIFKNKIHNCKTGIEIGGNKNQVYTNEINDNNKGLSISGNEVQIKNNKINNNIIGVGLSGDNGNITKNNFKNNIVSVILGSGENNWDENYWDKARIFPKILIGFIGFKISIDFDMNPASEPYEINI
jgi:parallel beta-helix repeat protein